MCRPDTEPSDATRLRPKHRRPLLAPVQWRGPTPIPRRAGAAGVHGRDAPALVEQVPPAAKSQQGFLKASWSLEKDTAEVVLRPGPLRRPSPVRVRAG